MPNLSLPREGPAVPSCSYRQADGAEKNTRALEGHFYVIHFHPEQHARELLQEASIQS